MQNYFSFFSLSFWFLTHYLVITFRSTFKVSLYFEIFSACFSEFKINESQTSRIVRLNKQREANHIRKQKESPTERLARLENQRLRTKRGRSKESTTSCSARINKECLINAFEKKVYVFADSICEICHKCCYSNQVSKYTICNTTPDYMPIELYNNSFLVLCHRCKHHLNSKNRMYPPKSFWNNLEPGVIPREIAILTQVEVRLLARIIPFLKIIKFDGVFGQYGFKGQAVLFGQDIFEVTEKLPSNLMIFRNGMILASNLTST